MKDKDKQIQLMAKTIDEATIIALNTLGSHNNGRGAWYAEYLVECGYGMNTDTIKEFVNEVENKTIPMYYDAKHCYQRNKGEVSDVAYGTMLGIASTMKVLKRIAEDHGVDWKC